MTRKCMRKSTLWTLGRGMESDMFDAVQRYTLSLVLSLARKSGGPLLAHIPVLWDAILCLRLSCVHPRHCILGREGGTV